MLRRLFSTILLWSLIGTCFYYGNKLAFISVIYGFIFLTQFELKRLFHWSHRPFHKKILWVLSAILVGLAISPETQMIYASLSIVSAILLLPRIFFRENPPYWVNSFLIAIYSHLLLFYFLIFSLFPNPELGKHLVLLSILLTKFSDTGAFLSGTLLGKHKLAEKISSLKSWEGVLGGALFALGTGYLFHQYCPVIHSVLSLWQTLFLGMILSFFAVIGDLLESQIKRLAGAKDSGHTLPGIGGIFDLTDSLLLTAPVAFIFFYIIRLA